MEPEFGRYFDGETARRHDVLVELRGGSLWISGETLGAELEWPVDQIRRHKDVAGKGAAVILSLLDLDGDETLRLEQRLEILDGALATWIEQHSPILDQAPLPKGIFRKIAIWTGGAAAAIALMLFVILPSMANVLANYIPREREIAFGNIVQKQIEAFLFESEYQELICEDAAGEAALGKMLAGLTVGHDLEYEIEVLVFDHELINAFALPGGKIILTRAMLEIEAGQSALAGVLAHEIGHVENRDPTRNALRSVGSAGLLSLVLGDFAGGIFSVVVAEQALNASFSRDAEEKADLYSVELLSAAGVALEPMAELFENEIPEMDLGIGIEVPAYLLTHPASDDRAAMLRSSAAGQGKVRTLLSDQEWRDIQTMCD